VRQFTDPFARTGDGAASPYRGGDGAQGGPGDAQAGQQHIQSGAQQPAGQASQRSERGERGATTH
jgi:hypothetical protein